MVDPEAGAVGLRQHLHQHLPAEESAARMARSGALPPAPDVRPRGVGIDLVRLLAGEHKRPCAEVSARPAGCGPRSGRGRRQRADPALAAQRAHDLSADVVDRARAEELDRGNLHPEDLLERLAVALDPALVPLDVAVEMNVEVQRAEGPGARERHHQAAGIELDLAVGVVGARVLPLPPDEIVDVASYAGQHGILAWTGAGLPALRVMWDATITHA